MDRARGISALERCDGFAPLRNALRHIAKEREHWAGIPMPLDSRSLVIEPKFPNADKLMEMGAARKRSQEDDGVAIDDKSVKVRNHWFSSKRHGEVYVYEKDGKIDWGVYRVHPLSRLLDTLDCADAWGVEQEGNAVQTLGEMLRHRVFKQYLLTGMFMETSARSGVTYMFRRLRPTIAISTRAGYARILAALCMHPIGYYAGTWAGAMTPTDDVIAHLALMRGDEHLFWRRCNQHPAWSPMAGLV